MEKSEGNARDIGAVARRIIGEGARPRTQGEERRQALVEAAYALIAEAGFEQLRTRDVAARVGVNIATLHYYFTTKEDLIQGVVEYLLRQFMTAYLPGSAIEMRTPLEQIQGEIAETQLLLRKKPNTFVVLNELALRSLHDPAIRAHLAWLEAGWRAYLEQVLRQGKEQGMFRADLDARGGATWLILLIKGATLHYMTDPEAINFTQIQAEIERWLTGQPVTAPEKDV